MDAKRRSLGMGLSALLGDETRDEIPGGQGSRMVPVARIRPGRYQPRRGFDEDKLEALAQSIRLKGILQPLLVRPDPADARSYELIAGERRWRAAQRAQLHEVPVIVRELADQEVLEIALVENLQREDLNPLEEAEAYQRLMREFHHTQEELAQAVGKSRSHVANTLRLLESSDKVRRYIDEGKLTAGHARALLRGEDTDWLADQIAEQGLSVRDAERLAAKTSRPKAPKPVEIDDLERRLSERWGLTVRIRSGSATSGTLMVQYQTLDQLDDFIDRVR